MVLGKKVAFFIGNGTEILPLEMGRKFPEMLQTKQSGQAIPCLLF